ncbi:MAG: hypothetical protein ACI857_001693 [Arenicella sp.]|jgi:hypothetical protein
MASENLPIVFIGSGPVSLLKAYLMSKKEPNQAILILDNNLNFGGAWYSDLRSDNSEIESGCHIWSYNKEVYHYLSTELELDMVKMKPAPLFVKGKLKVPYSIKNTVDSYKFLSKNLIRFNFKVFSTIKESDKYTLKIFGKQNQYAKMGSIDLVKELKKRIESSANIKVINGIRVNSIELNDSAYLISEAEKIEAKKIFMTSVTDLKTITHFDSSVQIEQKQVDYIHFLLKLEQPINKRISYWRLMEDQVIHRISDISYQTSYKENLLLVGIKQDAFETISENKLLEHCKGSLLKLRLIDTQDHVKLDKSYVYPTFYIDMDQRKTISEMDRDKLELLHSTDLMYGFHALIKEEKLT